jgi:uncharacterized membrane protein YuzA (DUF378 family)
VKTLHMVAYVLLWVGGLNWGLMGLLDMNLVNQLLGSMPEVERVVYILVGASAVYTLLTHMTDCRVCSKKK